jgi:hypothetical protein
MERRMALSALDRLEILDLMGRYNFAIDFGQAQDWADCFTDDGVFESPLSTASGRAELVAFAEAGASAKGVRHWVNNAVLAGDGAQASADVYLNLFQLAEEGAPRTLVAGRYADTLAKVGGAWKFRRRTVTFDEGSGVLAPPKN